jgi:LppP/LprE lipoprotein
MDQAVRAAGWFLFADSDQPFADTTIVKGSTAVDGMCRPWGYQFFVFVNGTFAGTLSPVPMNARTDGALVRVEGEGEQQLAAHYSRYAPTDPLCCPSRTSTVTYRVDRSSRVAVPISVKTKRMP